MLKGISRKVIVIKNPDSEIFEEAYFIVKNTKNIFKTAKENDMITEANRLITEYHKQQKRKFANQSGGQTPSDAAGGNEAKKISDISDISNNTGEKKEKKNIISECLNINGISDTEIKKSLLDMKGENFISAGADAGSINGSLHAAIKTDRNGENFKKDLKSAFMLLSEKKITFKKFDISLKSFLYGIGFMSAVVIVFKIVEMLL